MWLLQMFLGKQLTLATSILAWNNVDVPDAKGAFKGAFQQERRGLMVLAVPILPDILVSL